MIFETDFVQLEIAIFKSTSNYFVIIPRFDKASNGGIIFLFISHFFSFVYYYNQKKRGFVAKSSSQSELFEKFKASPSTYDIRTKFLRMLHLKCT